MKIPRTPHLTTAATHNMSYPPRDLTSCTSPGGQTKERATMKGFESGGMWTCHEVEVGLYSRGGSTLESVERVVKTRKCHLLQSQERVIRPQLCIQRKRERSNVSTTLCRRKGSAKKQLRGDVLMTTISTPKRTTHNSRLDANSAKASSTSCPKDLMLANRLLSGHPDTVVEWAIPLRDA